MNVEVNRVWTADRRAYQPRRIAASPATLVGGPDGGIAVDRREDLLLQLALEHRDLAATSEALRQRRSELTAEEVRLAAIAIVEHELAHRLMVHPLLVRDHRGCALLSERREEQLLLADRLRHALSGQRETTDADHPDPVVGLDRQLVAHADREEIVAFPHVRRVVDGAELYTLGALRDRLQEAVAARLLEEDSPVLDGSWASAPRRELPALLELPEDLVIELPDLEPSRSATSA